MESHGTGDETLLTVESFAALTAWLAEQGMRRLPAEQVFDGFCDRLSGLGIPLHRARTTMHTLHPTIETVSLHWDGRRDRDRFEFKPIEEPSEPWISSPLKAMLDGDIRRMRRRFKGPEATLHYPVLEEFATEGFTDFYARIYGFAPGARRGGTRRAGAGQSKQTGNLNRWMTRRDTGFTDAEIATIDALIPPLALALQVCIDREIAENILDAYLGRIAGRRVLSGQFRLGTTETIHAALMFADLSNFTAASDTLALDDLVESLNRLYDAMVGPVHDRGGNILKYLGDGFLAIFPIHDGADGGSCRAALAAAQQAVRDTAIVNDASAAAGEPTLPLHVALNLGDVAFGNVGGRGRLDFTVIGPAVNQASRIEKLCRPLERSILMTESFATTLDRDQVEDLGPHPLRGVRDVPRLFGVRAAVAGD